MKNKFLKLTATILAAASLLTFTSCATKAPNGEEQQSAQSTESQTAQYAAKLEYYSSLLAQIQDELLAERERNYLAEYEYAAKISELEKTVDELNAQLVNLGETSKDSSSELPSVFKEDNFTYVVSNGTATITSYTGKGEHITVPEIIDGYPVVKIGEGAFRDTDVVSVILPDTLKEIDWFAFSGCVSLTEIAIPSSVTSVGYGAFDYCTSRPTIICQKGSYIEAYAASWGMSFNSK